ncbi:hypothetical protein ACFL3K_00760, partial [Pseudomonadota bacterium]
MRSVFQRLFSHDCSVLFAVALALLPTVGVSAEQKIEKRVSSIEITGNRYIESATILANIETKVAQPLSKKSISQDV